MWKNKLKEMKRDYFNCTSNHNNYSFNISNNNNSRVKKYKFI